MSGNRASVLVAGGAGYVGSHVVLALLDAGYGVAVIDNLTTGCRWAVDQRAAFFEGNVENGSLVRTIMEMHGVAGVVHLAGTVPLPEGGGDPLAFYRGNAGTTRTLIESAIACGVGAFLYSSSAETYARSAAAPQAETAAQDPADAYGRSVLMAERMLRDAAAFHPLAPGILRYGHAAGADPQGRSGRTGGAAAAGNLVQQALDTVLGKRQHVDLQLAGNATPDGSLVSDYVHVCDVASAHVALLGALLADPARPLVLNCGHGRGVSQREVIAAVELVTNVRIARRESPADPGLPPSAFLDCRAIGEALGWQAEHASLEAMVRDAFRWEMRLQRMGAGEAISGTESLRSGLTPPAAVFTPPAARATAARPLRP